MRRLTGFFLFALTALSLTAAAQSAAPADAKAKVLGWSKTANLGVNLSFASSQSVVGQTDGSSQTYGANLKGGLNRVSESDEWRNTLSILGATILNP